MAAARWTERQVKAAQAKVAKTTPQKTTTAKAARKAKYRNERVEIDGIIWDSQKEAAYYQRLKLEKKAGTVKWFTWKVKFLLVMTKTRETVSYIADFIVVREDKLVWAEKVQVVDVKGFHTKEFEIKRKLMLEQHNIELLLE